MELWEQAYKDYCDGMKYQNIAEKYEVTINTVKSWYTRHWKNKKYAHKDKKSVHTKPSKSMHTKKGAPKGNKNAIGNDGGPPLCNKNAEKHGGYSGVCDDTLDDDERELIKCVSDDEEALLLEDIRLLSIRERRLMKAINKYRDAPGGLAVSGVTASYTKREFDTLAEEQMYVVLKAKKIQEGKIDYLGYDKSIQTDTDAAINIIQRLERELTSIQREKRQCIGELIKLRLENRRLDENDKGIEAVNEWVAAVMDAGDVDG